MRITPRASDAVGQGWGLRIFISPKFSGGADVSDPGPELSLAKKVNTVETKVFPLVLAVDLEANPAPHLRNTLSQTLGEISFLFFL